MKFMLTNLKFTLKTGFKILSCLLISSILLLLAACQTFGVPNDQWKTLSPEQKQVAMDNYYRQQRIEQKRQAEIDRINAENAPLESAISGLEAALPKKQRTWDQSHSETTGSCYGNECKSQTNTSSSSVHVTSPF